MVDAQSMKQLSFIGNMQMQYFSIIVLWIGDFSIKKRETILGWIQIKELY